MTDEATVGLVAVVAGAVGGALGFFVAFFTRRDEARLSARRALVEQLAGDVRAYAAALAALRAKIGEQCTAMSERRVELIPAIEAKRVELQGKVSTRSVPWLADLNAHGRELIEELNWRLKRAAAVDELPEPQRGEAFGQIEDDVGTLSRWSSECFRAWFTSLLDDPMGLGAKAELPPLPPADLRIHRPR